MFEVAWLDDFSEGRNTSGYSYASRKIIKELKKTNLHVHTHEDYFQQPTDLNLPPGIGYFRSFDINYADIIINNRLPGNGKIVNSSSAPLVSFSYWETDTLPNDFVKSLNQSDQVWTTSKWAKEVYINSGVNVDVVDFNLGVDTDIFNIQHSAPDGDFVFLSIGSPSTRKNTQMVVDAFLKIFNGRGGFKLIIKSAGSPDCRLILNGQNHGYVGTHPQIDVIDYEMTEDELSSLYDSAHCLVYPTSGEGWGMIPFQAIAKGIPTICTNATACGEFASLSIPLDYVWGTHNMSGVYRNAGMWAVPDFNDLCDKMVYVSQNHKEVKDFTMQGAWLIRNNYKWSDVAIDYYNAIIDLVV